MSHQSNTSRYVLHQFDNRLTYPAFHCTSAMSNTLFDNTRQIESDEKATEIHAEVPLDCFEPLYMDGERVDCDPFEPIPMGPTYSVVLEQ